MADSENNSKGADTDTSGIPGISQGKDQYSDFQLNRDMLKAYKNYINRRVDYHKILQDSDIKLLLEHFQNRFNDAFDKLEKFLENNEKKPKNPYLRFYEDGEYFNYLDDLLYLGIWDDDYANDPGGKLSPFGPLLIPLRNYKGRRRIGILHALEQQSAPSYNKNHLKKAQELAIEIHNHFWDFATDNGFSSNLKFECNYPPIVQLCAGGAATLLGGLPVPAFIVIDKTKTDEFSDFSALPHEIGHYISLTFKDSSLVKEITAHVKKLNIPHIEFWEMWIDECLADAISLAIIKEGEILSLANLFSNCATNIIPTDSTGEVDVHPVPHIRVLLAIAVGCILDQTKQPLFNKIEKKWTTYGEKMNGKDIIFKKEKLPMQPFVDKIDAVATALVDTPYDQLKGKKVREIFDGFKSKPAEDLIASIIKQKLLCK